MESNGCHRYTSQGGHAHFPVFRFQHVHFLFETNDFDRPTIRVTVPSISYGETWSSKLSILMP